MRKHFRVWTAAITLSLIIASSAFSPVRSEDAIEKAAIGVGVTAGNMWFIPVKAISVSMGLLSSAVSVIFSGGDVDLARQIVKDTTAEPYFINVDLAKKSIGERPELQSKK